MTEIATVPHGTGLAVAGEQEYWTDRQLAALRQIGVEGAGPGDLTVFMHVCQRTGLDPFARQIYMVRRDGKQVIQTGIDGYRLIARRAVDAHHERLSIGAPEWADHDGRWHEVWLQEGYPAAARVTVYRAGEPFPAVALWREYVQTTRDKSSGQVRVTKMWDQRAAGMLAKCAEALALRKAFPQDLSGIYVDAEMDRADTVQGHVVQQAGGLAAALQSSGAGPTPEQSGPVESNASSAPEPDPRNEPILLNTRSKLAKRMYLTINQAGISEKERLPYIASVIGREIESSKEMTEDEARKVIDTLQDALEEPFVEGEGNDQEAMRAGHEGPHGQVGLR